MAKKEAALKGSNLDSPPPRLAMCSPISFMLLNSSQAPAGYRIKQAGKENDCQVRKVQTHEPQEEKKEKQVILP